MQNELPVIVDMLLKSGANVGIRRSRYGKPVLALAEGIGTDANMTNIIEMLKTALQAENRSDARGTEASGQIPKSKLFDLSAKYHS